MVPVMLRGMENPAKNPEYWKNPAKIRLLSLKIETYTKTFLTYALVYFRF